MQTVLVIFFQMFGSTYKKGRTEIHTQSVETTLLFFKEHLSLKFSYIKVLVYHDGGNFV